MLVYKPNVQRSRKKQISCFYKTSNDRKICQLKKIIYFDHVTIHNNHKKMIIGFLRFNRKQKYNVHQDFFFNFYFKFFIFSE